MFSKKTSYIKVSLKKPTFKINNINIYLFIILMVYLWS